MKCFHCNTNKEMQTVNARSRFTTAGVTFYFPDEFDRCPDCYHESYSVEQSMKHTQALRTELHHRGLPDHFRRPFVPSPELKHVGDK